jgi:hypothetical protein
MQGYASPSWFELVIGQEHKNWINRYNRTSGDKGNTKSTNVDLGSSSEKLTDQEQQYVKSHKDEYRRNHLVDELRVVDWQDQTTT